MEKTDSRTLNQDEQFQIRKMVARLRENGMSYREIGEISGVSTNYDCTLYNRDKRDGDNAIAKGERGRRIGHNRTLNASQEATIRSLIAYKTPDQLKFLYGLWTRPAERELIQRQYGIWMPISTVGEYLRRWGFTPQKPQRRAYEQNPKEVVRWLNEEYPAICQRSREKGAPRYTGATRQGFASMRARVVDTPLRGGLRQSD